MQVAKLFQNGSSQAVRLPKEFRFDGQQVFIKRFGAAVMLLPYNHPWQSLIDSLDLFSNDFMDERVQPAQQPREQLFEEW